MQGGACKGACQLLSAGHTLQACVWYCRARSRNAAAAVEPVERSRLHCNHAQYMYVSDAHEAWTPLAWTWVHCAETAGVCCGVLPLLWSMLWYLGVGVITEPNHTARVLQFACAATTSSSAANRPWQPGATNPCWRLSPWRRRRWREELARRVMQRMSSGHHRSGA